MDSNAESEGWFETDDYGVVERLEAEAIVTSFYRVVIPVWPDHSAYVIKSADGSEQRIQDPAASPQRRARISARAVVAGRGVPRFARRARAGPLGLAALARRSP